jgi:hypothetical protein
VKPSPPNFNATGEQQAFKAVFSKSQNHSFNTVRRHGLFGRPGFLFPCGFHSSITNYLLTLKKIPVQSSKVSSSLTLLAQTAGF